MSIYQNNELWFGSTLSNFQLYHNLWFITSLVWLMPNLRNHNHLCIDHIFFIQNKNFFDSNQRFWDSIYTVSDRFGPDNYRCITRCERLIISKSDILTVLWLYSAFIRTFLTLIWRFNNSVSNWQYVHEDFFIPDCMKSLDRRDRMWPVISIWVALDDVCFV